MRRRAGVGARSNRHWVGNWTAGGRAGGRGRHLEYLGRGNGGSSHSLVGHLVGVQPGGREFWFRRNQSTSNFVHGRRRGTKVGGRGNHRCGGRAHGGGAGQRFFLSVLRPCRLTIGSSGPVATNPRQIFRTVTEHSCVFTRGHTIPDIPRGIRVVASNNLNQQ